MEQERSVSPAVGAGTPPPLVSAPDRGAFGGWVVVGVGVIGACALGAVAGVWARPDHDEAALRRVEAREALGVDTPRRLRIVVAEEFAPPAARPPVQIVAAPAPVILARPAPPPQIEPPPPEAAPDVPDLAPERELVRVKADGPAPPATEPRPRPALLAPKTPAAAKPAQAQAKATAVKSAEKLSLNRVADRDAPKAKPARPDAKAPGPRTVKAKTESKASAPKAVKVKAEAKVSAPKVVKAKAEPKAATPKLVKLKTAPKATKAKPEAAKAEPKAAMPKLVKVKTNVKAVETARPASRLAGKAPAAPAKLMNIDAILARAPAAKPSPAPVKAAARGAPATGTLELQLAALRAEPVKAPSARTQVAAAVVAPPAPAAPAAAPPARRQCDADSRAEALLCADAGLAARDRRLRAAYRRAEAAGVPQSLLRRTHARWLAARENAAAEAPWAVAQVYDRRIDELEEEADRARESDEP